MTKSDIRSHIRADALSLYGKGFFYDWKIYRGDEDDPIEGEGATNLYNTAEAGDEIHINVYVRKPGYGKAGYNIDNRYVEIPKENE